MNKGLQLQEIQKSIELIEQQKHDYHVNTQLLTMEPVGKDNLIMNFNGLNKQYHIKETAHNQIADRLKIPRTYYNRCRKENPGLLTTNVNTWFAVQPETRLVRTVGTDIRALLGLRYKPIDNILIAKFIIPYLLNTPSISIKSAGITDARLYIQAVSDKLQADVRVGDPVQAGITISNSEVGLGKVKVEYLLYFLQCQNGMTTREVISRVHLGGSNNGGDGDFNEFKSDNTRRLEDEALVSGMKDMINTALTDKAPFMEQVSKLRNADQDKIETSVPEIVEVTKKVYSLTDKEEEGVVGRLYESKNYTRYGLSAAFTSFANDLENYDRAVDFQKMGGKIIEIPKRIWQDWNTINRN